MEIKSGNPLIYFFLLYALSSFTLLSRRPTNFSGCEGLVVESLDYLIYVPAQPNFSVVLREICGPGRTVHLLREHLLLKNDNPRYAHQNECHGAVFSSEDSHY